MKEPEREEATNRKKLTSNRRRIRVLGREDLEKVSGGIGLRPPILPPVER